jgi:mannose-6-phosphate isomerase-like protein (cupin superfamily)
MLNMPHHRLGPRQASVAERHPSCSRLQTGGGAQCVHIVPIRRPASTVGMPYTEFRHAGVEFIYMLSGKVRYRHGDRSYVLEPGDALFFDAAARHGPEELMKAPMNYLSIIIYPRRS